MSEHDPGGRRRRRHHRRAPTDEEAEVPDLDDAGGRLLSRPRSSGPHRHRGPHGGRGRSRGGGGGGGGGGGEFDPDSYVRPDIAASLPPLNLDDDVDTDTDESYTSAGGGEHPERPFEPSSDEDYELELGPGGGSSEELLPPGATGESPAAYARFGYRPPPRSPWNPPDSTLRPVPPLYPPLDPRSSAYVDDASPSIVAARIAECLRKRSVVAEYDDEGASCVGLAYDGSPEGVRFHVRLYRGGRGRSPPDPNRGGSASASTGGGEGGSSAEEGKGEEEEEVRPDFSAGVVVELRRVRGDAMAYGRLRRSVLLSAAGDSDGCDDLRLGCGPAGGGPPTGMAPPARAAAVLAAGAAGDGAGLAGAAGTAAGAGAGDEGGDDEATPLPALLPRSPASSAPATAIDALLLSLDLLRKDRLDAQLLGMEGVVKLTDARVSGMPSSILASLVVVGAPVVRGAGMVGDEGQRDGDDELLEVHGRVVEIIMKHDVGSAISAATNRSSRHSPGRSVASAGIDGAESTAAVGWDAEHVGSMRLLALRALSNALTVLSSHRTSAPPPRRHNPPSRRRPVTLLRGALRSHRPARRLASPPFVFALASDLGGSASRPPSAVFAAGGDGDSPWGARSGGSGLGCAHDAALRCRCLRLLAAGSEEARGIMLTLGTSGVGDASGRTPRPVVVEALRRARLAGRARHGWLEREAGRALEALLAGGGSSGGK